MKMTEKEKGLMSLFKKLESDKCKNDLIFHAEAMVRAQEALKADYGLLGPDATLFNAAAVSYTMPSPGPLMGEVVNA